MNQRLPKAAVLCGIATFLSAFLLFAMQPLVGKFVLPWFGGVTSVWTTCLLFFQVVLLLGYAYAHLLARVRSIALQLAIHSAILLAAFAFLPIIPSETWKPGASANPTWQILLLLVSCFAIPYLALAATSPLLQAWFNRAFPEGIPYRLYALSNLGSLLALGSFPLIFEPLFTRKAMAWGWSFGFGIFAITLIVCGILMARRGPIAIQQNDAGQSPAVPLASTAFNRAMWLLLPACSSCLLLATTNKICQDIAVVPFLWIVPLGLYLLSFVICFDSAAWYSRRIFACAFAFFLTLECFALFEGAALPIVAQVAIFSGALFAVCMVLHGELYRLRPAPRQLTAYYLTISLGSALGAAFVTLLAPRIFSAYYELHWGLWISVAALALIFIRESKSLNLGPLTLPVSTVLLLGLLTLGGVLLMHVKLAEKNVIARTRNFYSVLRVCQYNSNLPNMTVRELRSGEIAHGAQYVNPLYAQQPTTYYHEKTGVGLVLQAMEGTPEKRIGAVGLGTGTLACYTRAGDSIRFYEINPLVKQIDDRYFTYLKEAEGKVHVIFGDARLSLEREAPQQLDLLVLDAFSGDAIPVHLLTKEAFHIYARHTKTNGVIAVHVTNRHLDLVPVVQNLAQAFGYLSLPTRYDPQVNRAWWYKSRWVLLSKNAELLSRPELQAATERHSPDEGKTIWTDDHASLLPLLSIRP